MRIMTLVAGLCLALVLGLACVSPVRAESAAEGALRSVVSVLPVWPGRAEDRTGPRRAPEGSGVAVAPGVIATAWHVVEPASRVDVRLWDGRVVPAEILASDPMTDIALLSVGADLPAFDDAVLPALGDPVCTIGNAFGLGLSVTCGVVSALGVTNAGFNPIEDFVQTDAAMNPGASGGALVDRDGRLVGMMSAIFASNGDGNIGVNFAVSARLLARVTDSLVEHGDVAYRSVGWRLEMPERAALTLSAAPRVASSDPEGVAAQAGIVPGDRIARISGRAIRHPRDAVTALALIDPDETSVTVDVLRDERVHEVVLTFAPPPETAPEPTAQGGSECPHPAAVCHMRQAVFPVSSFDPLGSATRIGDDLLVTNRHVVGDWDEAVVFTPDGPREARVVPSAYRGDLALLRVDGLPEGGAMAALSPGGEPGTVYAIGADIAEQSVRVFAPGEVLSPPAEGAALGRWHVTATMQPGVSGGALVDETGHLIGIATGGGQGRFEAVPVADVTRLTDLAEAPDAAEVQRTLGSAYTACADALDLARQSGVADDLVPPCAEAANAGQLLEAGRVLSQAGRFADGAALHAQAAAQVPNSVNARVSLLVSLQLSGRFEEMLPHARRVLELAPKDPQVLRFAIQSGVWGGDTDLAEAGYAALLAADPRQAQAARRFIDAPPPAPPRR